MASRWCLVRRLIRQHNVFLTFFNTRRGNIVPLCSFLGCLVGERAATYGDLSPVNGRKTRTERLMFRRDLGTREVSAPFSFWYGSVVLPSGHDKKKSPLRRLCAAIIRNNMAIGFSSVDVRSAAISARVRIEFRQLSGYLICSHTLEFENIDGCMCYATDYVAKILSNYSHMLLVPTYHLQYCVKEVENG